VDDVLVRRVHLYYETPDRGQAAAHRTAELLGHELGWPRTRMMEEEVRYRALTEGSAAPSAD
jgi:glycerol-3-phosphate dehydrogenase